MKRPLILFVALLTLLSFASVARASKPVSNTPGVLAGVANGSAYAGYLQVPAGSSIASVGQLFPVDLGCNTSPQTISSTAASSQLGVFASSGSLTDQVTSIRSSATASFQASSTVQNVNILGGLITATAVRAVASSQANASSASSTNNSHFAHLVIAGVAISGTPGPNTTIALPGLGSVVLNEQSGPNNSANITSISVTAIDVHITLANIFGLPVGTHIIIAHAQSRFIRTSIRAIVNAGSYGLYVIGKAGSNSAASGPWAEAWIGCTSGSKTVSVDHVNVHGIANTGTITDMASGQLTSSGPQASSSSNTHNVNLLNGLITADVITATAQASFSGSASISGSTTLVNATIAGRSISANPGPNTRIDIANLGFVMVNEQEKNVSSTLALMKVNAFDLYVTTANSFGLPIGARIVIGRAFAEVYIY